MPRPLDPAPAVTPEASHLLEDPDEETSQAVKALREMADTVIPQKVWPVDPPPPVNFNKTAEQEYGDKEVKLPHWTPTLHTFQVPQNYTTHRPLPPLLEPHRPLPPLLEPLVTDSGCCGFRVRRAGAATGAGCGTPMSASCCPWLAPGQANTTAAV